MNPFVGEPNIQFNPPLGVQDPGEHGPYYVTGNEDDLIELPSENICRDYNYVLTRFEIAALKCLSEWLNSFESSAVLIGQRVRSRALVVVTDNGWQRGEQTEYTWCIRVCFNSQITMPVMTSGSVELHPYSMKFGHKILWPLPPLLAQKAYDSWCTDPTLMNSTLIKFYKPSPSVFRWQSILGAVQIDAVNKSTVCALHHINATPLCSEDRIFQPVNKLRKFIVPDSQNPRKSRFSSNLVASRLQFTATDNVGWNALCTDMTDLIFEMVAQECINTTGGYNSASFQTWMALRRICKESKRVVDDTTFKFMHEAQQLAVASLKPVLSDGGGQKLYSVERATRLRKHLVPRGLVPLAFFKELFRVSTLPRDQQDELSRSIFPYIRIRLEISIERPLPKALVKHSVIHAHMRQSSRLKAKTTVPESPRLFESVSLVLKCPTTTIVKPKQQKTEDLVDTWVQCSSCDEWRLLPDSESVSNLPNKWHCRMHPLGIYTCDTGSGRSTRRTTRQRLQ